MASVHADPYCLVVLHCLREHSVRQPVKQQVLAHRCLMKSEPIVDFVPVLPTIFSFVPLFRLDYFVFVVAATLTRGLSAANRTGTGTLGPRIHCKPAYL